MLILRHLWTRYIDTDGFKRNYCDMNGEYIEFVVGRKVKYIQTLDSDLGHHSNRVVAGFYMENTYWFRDEIHYINPNFRERYGARYHFFAETEVTSENSMEKLERFEMYYRSADHATVVIPVGGFGDPFVSIIKVPVKRVFCLGQFAVAA